MDKVKKKIWKSVILCIFWTIWKERNCIAFSDGSLAVKRLKNSFVNNLWSWNNQYISKGGCAMLIKSTLSNLPIYFLSLLHLPKTMNLRLEQIQRNVLWGGGRMDKKPHLVGW